MPNLYWREAPGASPDDAAATARANGGVPDERLVGDVAGATAYLKSLGNSNGKVGTIGYCSGGRQSFLSAVSLDLDAAVDCYGAFIAGEVPEGHPLKVGPILDKTPNLSCPLLGLFGAEDKYPSPEHVAELEEALKANGKTCEFTATRTPATPSSRSTARPTVPRPPWRAGTRSSPSTPDTSQPNRSRLRRPWPEQ
jgi:carboxymethylenebutenolidase